MKLTFEELEKLSKKYGDAMYLFDAETMRRNYDELLGAFRSIYPRTVLAYSYKTNYLPRLCRFVDLQGGFAEVVSMLEYELARRLGVDPQRIIFNGPLKREPELRRALCEGAVVNLDGPCELEIIEGLARRHPEQTLRVGLRCAFDIGSTPSTRFGFDVEGEDFFAAVRSLRSLSNVAFEGLHCHFLPEDRSPKAYRRIALRMLALSTTVFEGHGPRFIDVGGGFCSPMPTELAEQFPFPIPDFSQYADAIATPFRESFSSEEGPELVIEPGMAVVADAMRFVCRVVDVKTSLGRTSVLLSGSVYNVKPNKSRRNLPVHVATCQVEGRSAIQGPVDLVGYTCMEDDVLFRGYQGTVAVGDFVVFENVGAYTFVLKPPFIMPSPPLLACDPEMQTVEVVRREETFDDLFATYLI
jgi:diaminopimelate decarboxylase